ncbi:sushi-like protein [Plakobranchus ocellatus]|uniref:Sushi-like protein n=1 Tax=Plakobranchus ocellatus TaxID=259542 RepID=A0AAV4BGG3_9GAST|nr:sushi-like protein [Plakobranchus ocellatus]
MTEGEVRQYGIFCNAYWECVGFFPQSNATCCPSGEAFDGTACVPDATCNDTCPPPADFVFPPFCPYSVSPHGPEYYRVYTQTQIIDKACPSGLVFSVDLCFCNGTASDFCNEDLRLTFENQTIEDYSKNQQRLTLYPMARMFAFPNDTTVNFWGPNYIIAPGFANKEFWKISVVVVFEPTGATNDQVLVHNGPVSDPDGPSIKISISDGASGTLDVSFTLLTSSNTSASPLVINVPKGGPIEARLQYDGSDVGATVLKEGVTVGTASRQVMLIDDPIALRKGAFNIGGGGCLGCNNYVGSMDYIKVFDCVAKTTDLGEAAAAGLQDIITLDDGIILPPTPAARFFPAATTPSEDNNLDFFQGIAHVPYSGDCGKFLQCQIDTTFLFNVTIKDCPFGTMWSSGLEACSRPFQAECDPCKGIGDNVRFPYPNYCQAYLQCSGGVSQIRCCADNEIYDEASGCVNDPSNSCNNTCVIEPDSAYTCFFTNSTMGDGFYYDMMYEVDRPCPRGLGFNTTDCGCTNVIGDTSTVCSPYVDLEFDWYSVLDKSINNFTVDYNFITIDGNVGDFSNTRSNIAVLGTANVEYFASQFGLVVNFSAPSSFSGNQTIVYNGRLGSESQSVRLSIRNNTASTIIVSFLLVTEDDTSETAIEVQASSSGFVYASMVYDGLKVTVKTISGIGTMSAARAATGNVVRKQGAVNIGSGLCFDAECDPFGGKISSVKLYLCAPAV